MSTSPLIVKAYYPMARRCACIAAKLKASPTMPSSVTCAAASLLVGENTPKRIENLVASAFHARGFYSACLASSVICREVMMEAGHDESRLVFGYACSPTQWWRHFFLVTDNGEVIDPGTLMWFMAHPTKSLDAIRRVQEEKPNVGSCIDPPGFGDEQTVRFEAARRGRFWDDVLRIIGAQMTRELLSIKNDVVEDMADLRIRSNEGQTYRREAEVWHGNYKWSTVAPHKTSQQST